MKVKWTPETSWKMDKKSPLFIPYVCLTCEKMFLEADLKNWSAPQFWRSCEACEEKGAPVIRHPPAKSATEKQIAARKAFVNRKKNPLVHE